MLNRYTQKEMTEGESIDCDRFTWNAKCTEEQIKRMQELRQAGKDLCQLFIANTPNCADRSAAIRYLRLAVMQCNVAIAHEDMSQ